MQETRSKVQLTSIWLPNPQISADWKRDEAMAVFLRESFHGELAKYIPSMGDETKKSAGKLSKPEISKRFNKSREDIKKFSAMFKKKGRMEDMYPRHFGFPPETALSRPPVVEQNTSHREQTEHADHPSGPGTPPVEEKTPPPPSGLIAETVLDWIHLPMYLDEDRLKFLLASRGFEAESVEISAGASRTATIRFASDDMVYHCEEACREMKDAHLKIRQIAIDVHPVQVVAESDPPSTAMLQTILQYMDAYTPHVFRSADRSSLVLYTSKEEALKCVEKLDGFNGWRVSRLTREGPPDAEAVSLQQVEIVRRRRVKQDRRDRRDDRLRGRRRRQQQREDEKEQAARDAKRELDQRMQRMAKARFIRQHECEAVPAWVDLPPQTCAILISNPQQLSDYQIEDILTATDGQDQVFVMNDEFHETVHSIQAYEDGRAAINCFGYVTRDRLASQLKQSSAAEVRGWNPQRVGFEVVFEWEGMFNFAGETDVILGQLNRFGPIVRCEVVREEKQIHVLYENYDACRILSDRQRVGGRVFLGLLRIKSVTSFDRELHQIEPSKPQMPIVRFSVPKMTEEEKREEELVHRIMCEGYTRSDGRAIAKKSRFQSLQHALDFARRTKVPTREERIEEGNPNQQLLDMKRQQQMEIIRIREEEQSKRLEMERKYNSSLVNATEQFHFQFFIQQLKQDYDQKHSQWDRERKRIRVMNASKARHNLPLQVEPPEPRRPDIERFMADPPACMHLIGETLISADQVMAQLLAITGVRAENVLHVYETGNAWVVMISEKEIADMIIGGINSDEELHGLIQGHSGLPAQSGGPVVEFHADSKEPEASGSSISLGRSQQIRRTERAVVDPRDKKRRDRIATLRRKNAFFKRKWVDVPNVERSELFSLLTADEKITHLKRSQDRIKAGKSRAQAALIAFRNAQECDLCFCLDITGSMGKYMDECRSKIQNVLADVSEKWSHLKVRVAFVGYRDHGDEPRNGGTRFVIVDFIENIPEFETRLNAVVCRGGIDWCEDVIGGLEQSLQLNWASTVRLLYHVCDAPPHGSIFYDYPESARADRFPNAHERRDLQPDYCDVLQRMRNEDIWYVVAKCRDDIDVMLRKFRHHADSMNDDDEYGDKWYIQGTDLSDASNLAKQLGKTINKTILTKSQACLAAEMAQKTEYPNRLGRITNYSSVRDVQYDEVNSAIWMCMDVEDIDQLTDDLRDVYMEIIPKEEMVRVSDLTKPFAKGAVRYCYFGRIPVERSEYDKAGFYSGYFEFLTRDHPEWRNEQHGRVMEQVVLKRPITTDPAQNSVEAMQDEMIGQKTADYLAIQFNRVLGLPLEKHLRFVPLKLVRIQDRSMDHHNFTAEPFIEGKFIKFSGNLSESIEEYDDDEKFENMDEIKELALSYAHFTYEFTNHFMMVVDIQGFSTNGWFVLTDPALHSDSLKYPPTDMGHAGMTEYLKSHDCNQYCAQWQARVAMEIAARDAGGNFSA